jgi:hypothetical protein
MHGEELEKAFLGFSGVYGDRLFAFKSFAAPKGFPYLTGREQEEMLLYRPRFRHPERAVKPPNLSEAEGGYGARPLAVLFVPSFFVVVRRWEEWLAGRRLKAAEAAAVRA